MVQQSTRRNMSVVDEDLLLNRQNKKAFKAAAYAMGFGLGMIFLVPMLPLIDDAEKMTAMKDIFRALGFCLIGYSIAVTVTFFVARPNLPVVLGFLNWIIIPMLACWVVVQAHAVLSQ